MSRSPEPETLVDLARDNVAVIDETGRFRYLNAATRDLLGFDPDGLVGTDAFDLVHPDDVARVRAVFDALVADGTRPDAPLEYRYGTADGDWVWFRTRVFPPAETGFDGYALRSRDVTLEVESRRRLETIASTSPDVLWMFDADWSELPFVNGAAERDRRAVPVVGPSWAEPDGRATAPAAGSEAAALESTETESTAAEATDAESATVGSTDTEPVAAGAADRDPADREPAADTEPVADPRPEDSDAAPGPS